MAMQRNNQRKQDELDPEVLDLTRVARVSSGGRRFRFRAVVVAGDKKGQVGVGVAKGSHVAQAIEKATMQAKKSLKTINISGHTIPRQITAKFASSEVMLRPQQEGRGIVAGGPVRVICAKAGIKDISAKFISRSHNKLNNAMATMAALEKMSREYKEKKIVEEEPQKEAVTEGSK